MGRSDLTKTDLVWLGDLHEPEISDDLWAQLFYGLFQLVPWAGWAKVWDVLSTSAEHFGSDRVWGCYVEAWEKFCLTELGISHPTDPEMLLLLSTLEPSGGYDRIGVLVLNHKLRWVDRRLGLLFGPDRVVESLVADLLNGVGQRPGLGELVLRRDMVRNLRTTQFQRRRTKADYPVVEAAPIPALPETGKMLALPAKTN